MLTNRQKELELNKEESNFSTGLAESKKSGISQQCIEKTFNLSQISLLIDDYNGIFSDFDPRPYSQRAISDDFLIEAKKFARENLAGKLELRFPMPEAKRDKKDEVVIKKRLKEFFIFQHKHFLEKKKKIYKKGTLFVAAGIVVMGLTTLVIFKALETSLLFTFLGVLGEPAGWFLFWEGLDLLVFDPTNWRSELEFNKKMSNIEIIFDSYPGEFK